ncbi:MAG: hypothetical protein GY850_36965 [bacterium]|nr:hypothetical protein [bacterium]
MIKTVRFILMGLFTCLLCLAVADDTGAGNFMPPQNSFFVLNASQSLTIKARVVPRMVGTTVVKRKWEPVVETLKLRPDAAWTAVGGLPVARMGGVDGQSPVMFLNLADREIHTGEYPLFAFAYETGHDFSQPDLRFRFDVDTDGDARPDIRMCGVAYGEKRLERVEILDMRRVAYMPKDNRYRFRRELGLAPDGTWYHSRDGQYTLLQRRFDMPVAEVPVMKLTCRKVASLQFVNIWLDTDGNGRRDRLVKYENMVRGRETVGGLLVESVDLAATLKKLGLSTTGVRINEVVWWFDEDVIRLQGQGLVREMVFCRPQQQPAQAAGGFIEIAPEDFRIGNIRYLQFDLAGVLQVAGFADGQVTGVRIAMQPSADIPQQLQIRKIQFMATEKKTLPGAVASAEDILKSAVGGGLPRTCGVDDFEMLWWEDLSAVPFYDLWAVGSGPFAGGRLLLDKKSLPTQWRDLAGRFACRGKGPVDVQPDGQIRLGPGSTLRFEKALDRAVTGLISVTSEDEVRHLNRKLELSYLSPSGQHRTLRRQLPQEGPLVVQLPQGSILERLSLVYCPVITGLKVSSLNGGSFLKPGIIGVRMISFFDRAAGDPIEELGWTLSQDTLLFVPRTDGKHLEDRTVYTLPAGQKARWSLDLPDPDFDKATGFSFTYQISGMGRCRALLKVGERQFVFELYPGEDVIDFPLWVNGSRKVQLQLVADNTGSGHPLILYLDKPQLTVHVRKNALPQALLAIDGRPVPFSGGMSLIAVPRWFETLPVRLEAGNHRISLLEHPDFSVQTVSIAVDGMRWEDAAEPEAGPGLPSTKPSSGIFGRALRLLWLPLLLVTGYLLRGLLIQRPAAAIRRIYARRGDRVWLVVWLAGGCFFYFGAIGFSLGGYEAMGFDLGAMSLVAAYAHGMRLMRLNLLASFPRISGIVFRSCGSAMIVGGLALLTAVSLILNLDLEPVAEQVAVVAYYCLVAGVVLEIAQVKKNREAV